MGAITRPRWVVGSVLATAVVIAVVVLVLGRSGPAPDVQAGPPTGTTATPSSPGTQPSVPERTTTVAPPTPGTIDQTVAAVSAGPTAEADLDDPVRLPGELTVDVLGVEATEVEAVGPGETDGPALVVQVRLANASDSEVDVDGAQVSLLYEGESELAIPTPAGPAAPFVGRLGAGSAMEGRYVFRVPRTEQEDVTILVTYAAGAPVARFDGAVA